MFPKKYLPEDRMRQRVCQVSRQHGGNHSVQGSPELRALAAKLEQAYINKERSAQVGPKGHQAHSSPRWPRGSWREERRSCRGRGSRRR